MSYLIVMTGRNCAPWAQRALESVARQHGDFRVHVTDDASDDATPEIVTEFCRHDDRFTPTLITGSPNGTMRNQYEAWNALQPDDGDVIVWVDLDDRLYRDNDTFAILDREYDAGALVTYGSYIPDPPSDTCPRVFPYPPDIRDAGLIRTYTRKRIGGIRFNHLRTVSWTVLQRIPAGVLQDRARRWFTSGPDFAVMIPAIELAGQHTHFIPEILYAYTSDNPYSEWRRWNTNVNKAHQTVLGHRAYRPLDRQATR